MMNQRNIHIKNLQKIPFFVEIYISGGRETGPGVSKIYTDWKRYKFHINLWRQNMSN